LKGYLVVLGTLVIAWGVFRHLVLARAGPGFSDDLPIVLDLLVALCRLTYQFEAAPLLERPGLLPKAGLLREIELLLRDGLAPFLGRGMGSITAALALGLFGLLRQLDLGDILRDVGRRACAVGARQVEVAVDVLALELHVHGPGLEVGFSRDDV